MKYHKIINQKTINQKIKNQNIMPVDLKAICIEIKKPRTKPLLVSSWYGDPDLNVGIFGYFETFQLNAEQENRDIIITGDLYCNLLAVKENGHVKKLKMQCISIN